MPKQNSIEKFMNRRLKIRTGVLIVGVILIFLVAFLISAGLNSTTTQVSVVPPTKLNTLDLQFNETYLEQVELCFTGGVDEQPICFDKDVSLLIRRELATAYYVQATNICQYIDIPANVKEACENYYLLQNRSIPQY